jgi:DNA-binding transcriptional LysR family regulator
MRIGCRRSPVRERRHDKISDRPDRAAGRLVRILEDWTPPLAPLCLYYYNRNNSSAAFQAFIALARDFTAGKLA